MDALAAALGGLDGLVFSAAIRANSARFARRCGALGWLGVGIDGDTNRNSGMRISAASSRVAVLRIPNDEELMIAGLPGRYWVRQSAPESPSFR